MAYQGTVMKCWWLMALYSLEVMTVHTVLSYGRATGPLLVRLW